jgi:hypothetical protein
MIDAEDVPPPLHLIRSKSTSKPQKLSFFEPVHLFRANFAMAISEHELSKIFRSDKFQEKRPQMPEDPLQSSRDTCAYFLAKVFKTASPFQTTSAEEPEPAKEPSRGPFLSFVLVIFILRTPLVATGSSAASRDPPLRTTKSYKFIDKKHNWKTFQELIEVVSAGKGPRSVSDTESVAQSITRSFNDFESFRHKLAHTFGTVPSLAECAQGMQAIARLLEGFHCSEDSIRQVKRLIAEKEISEVVLTPEQVPIDYVARLVFPNFLASTLLCKFERLVNNWLCRVEKNWESDLKYGRRFLFTACGTFVSLKKKTSRL